MEHTKLPWIISSTCLICGEDGRVIASLIPTPPITSEIFEARANAEFILRVCNSYDRDQEIIKALLEACKKAEEILSTTLIPMGVKKEGTKPNQAYIACQQALAEAEKTKN